MRRACAKLMLALLLIGAAGGTGGCSNQRQVLGPGEANRDPQRARDLHEKAIKKIEEEKWDEAAPLLEQAVAADPSLAAAHNNLGIVYYEQGRLYDAANAYDAAIRVAPSAPQPRNNLGLVLMRAGKMDEAVRRFEQAAGIDENNPEYLGNLLKARLKRGENGPDIRQQLDRLIFIETRENWREWAKEQLVLLPRENDIRRPAAAP